jgi:hypothetical protein
MTAPAPYPADTRAKGWRFEIDLEQVIQSDTWALARPAVRPWLLMLWTVAWQQVPCGSMPADDELIIARLGIEPDVFEQHKKTLLRGWWQADDGRLYHPTITQRVLDMLGKKDAEKTRKAEYRRRKEAEAKLADINSRPDLSHGTDMEMSHGTDAGRTWESCGSDDTRTRTRTRTGTGLDSSNPPPRAGEGPEVSHGTAAGFVCKAIRAKGIADVNPSNPTLLALLDAGATKAEFEAAAESAVKAKAGFAYVLSVVRNERTRAASLVGQLHQGPQPTAAPPTPVETAHARKMRETVEGLAPRVARRPTLAQMTTPMTIETEAPYVPAIASH